MTPRPRQRTYVIWNLSRDTGSGIEVDRGPEDRMRESAETRNVVAAAKGMTGAVFVALPAGQKPTGLDIPPLPPAEPARPAKPRPWHQVQTEAADLGRSADRRVPELVDEAYQTGRAEARRSLGVAWGAFLGVITEEQWVWIFEDRPDLKADLRKFVLGKELGRE